MNRLALAICFALIGINISHAQQTISFEEVLKQSTTANATGEAFFDNKTIITENAALKRKRSLFTYWSEKYPQTLDNDGFITVPNRVVFRNCTFSEDIDFMSFHFVNGLEVSSSQISRLSIDKSKGTDITFIDNTVSNAIELTNSQFNSIRINRNQVTYQLLIENCTAADIKIESNQVSKGELDVFDTKVVDGTMLIGDNVATAETVEGCTITLGPYGEFNHYKLPGTASADLYLRNNVFEGDSTTRVIFTKGNYLNLDISNNTFNNNVYFVENYVHERFFLVSNSFKQYVSFEKFLFSEIWNELYWDQLKGYKLRYVDYGATSASDFDEDIKFKNLINIYKDLHSIFIRRGDLQSANACYSEMKDLQGQMLKHNYNEHSTFGNLLRWQLNVLLRIYTNHGTDPGLAVVMSLYVILIFSILYVFFPSEWDADSKNRLLISYEKLLQSKGKSYLAPALVVAGSLMVTITNSITLSINSFVTLGFGSIPTRGFARYLCIIEGFIGWFLLSIFTVSLINQVLA